MFENKLYCYECDDDVSVKYINKEVSHIINKEDITIEVKMPYCEKCGEELSDLELEEMRYDIAYDRYRTLKRLLFPDEIKEIREKYGLSQRAFSRVLGFGESTINRYELGALQDNANNIIIKLSEEPQNMLKLLEQNQDNLSENERKLLSARIDEITVSNSELECPREITVSKQIVDRIIDSHEQLNKKINSIDKKLENLGIEYKEKLFTNTSDWPRFDSNEENELVGSLDNIGGYRN